MNVDVYNLKNEKVGTAVLPDALFARKWNAVLVKQVLDAQLANKRRPWAHAKDRSEVSGGGRKPWRQKGTGRARHGSTRSPLWRHGGKAHGPRNEKDYSEKVNKKMKRAALFAVLSKKVKDGEIKVFENFDLAAPKTKILAGALREIIAMKKNAKRYDALFVAAANDTPVFHASKNLSKAKTLDAGSLNIYDILNHKHLLVEKDAIGAIEKHYTI